MVCALGRAAARSRAENREAAADLCRTGAAGLRASNEARMNMIPRITGWALGMFVVAFAADAQTPAAKVSFDGARAYDHLRQVVSFGPRPAGAPPVERTRRDHTPPKKGP